ncbi:Suppressor of glycerol defect protein 1 [Candida viswanathii]|uniref:Suppressor of glycerol defect protein 1 n=1 Tax=Candida viswanathii TaxID=5486 RepID=A0A367YBD1_9ASCO|nr:Suppressor of glycerol defect protein 1 [Candida viswanathii]
MARFKEDEQDGNGMKLPSRLLEQIKDKADDEEDERFSQVSRGQKRKAGGKAVSRKEKRKQERQLKKQKRIQSHQVTHAKKQEAKPVTKTNKKKEERVEDPLEALRKLKESKNGKSKKEKQVKVVKEEELIGDDDFDSDDFGEEFDDEEEEERDPMEALRALKAKKNGNANKSEVRIVKEDDLEDDEFSDEEFDEEDEEEEQDPMEALRALKAKKNGSGGNSEIRIVKEDELDDDELSDFDDDEEEEGEEADPMEALRALKKNKNGSSSEVRIVKEDDLDDDGLSDFDDDEEEEEEEGDDDPMEALRALKAKKNGKSNTSEIRIVKEDDLEDDEISDLGSEDENQEGEDDFGGFDEEEEEEEEDLSELEEEDDPIAKLKALKEAKKGKKDKKSTKSDEIYPMTPQLREQFAKDDEEMEYYAKKLGLKNGKKSKLSKTDDDDIIGGLLDGLDLDFGSDDGDSSEEDYISEEMDEDFSEDEGESEGESKVKENPYVAPGGEDSNEVESESAQPQRYIPPALRRKMALEAGDNSNEVSEETLKLRKSIKGPLNKLSEANINTIVNDLNTLYLSHPRQTLNEEITNIILDSIVQQGRLLDTFVYLHASVVVALYRLQGVEFGAHFIQTVIEKFEEYNKESSKTKEASNIISLLSSVYLFQLVSCKLLYDIIKELISNLDENNADLLLRLIRNSGNQMRSDDPTALKEIVLLINGKVSSLPKDSINTRTQFLIETISSLKNNKLKIVNEGNHQLSIRLKKFLGTINNNKFGDPIQVSLDDIHNVETRGKWWLVGSAWKGHTQDQASSKHDVDELAMNDILDNAEPNWMELAKSQRMNTDIRRAIFVSIMSANDYIDAVTKLDKLSLKRSQEREIPKVLIHCTTMEPSWNPYYGVLANKLCDSHSLRKTFQFMFWDLIKDLDGGSGDNDDEDDDFMGFDNDDGDEEAKMKRILNLGRFYGFLLAEGTMPLHNLRTVNFLTASSDTVLFLEVVLVSFLDQVGKKSAKNSVGAGLASKKKKKDMFEQKFDDKILVERVLKAKDQNTLLRGLQYFLQEKVKTSDITTGKKQKQRVAWGVDAMFDIIDEFLKDSEE